MPGPFFPLHVSTRARSIVIGRSPVCSTERARVNVGEAGRRLLASRSADGAGQRSVRSTGLGEGLDAGADGGEAVLAGGREVARDAELLEEDGLGRGDVGRRAAFVKVDEEGDEASDERGVGVEGEVEGAVTELCGHPDLGNAAVNAVGFGARGFGERRVAAGAIHDGGEAFVAVLDKGEVLDELCLVFGYAAHRGARQGWMVVSGPRSFSKRVLSVAFM